MKSLQRIIKEERMLDSKSLLLEGKIKSMDETKWLNYLYSNGRSYIQSVYDPKQTHALYGIYKDEVDGWKEELKKNKGISSFRVVKTKHEYAIICFKYDRSKDQLYKDAIDGEAEKERKAAEEFDNEVKNADTTKYSCNDKDINKMKEYFNKRSDPNRLANSIKDPSKLVARWIASMMISWEDAASALGYEIGHRKILTKAEIVAYTEKYKDQKVDDSDMNRLDKEVEKIATSWITKSLFKYFETLSQYKIEWKEAFKNAKTQVGQDAMRKNGRAWTEGFIVSVSTISSDKTVDIKFDIITNEGGGLYGYSLGYDVLSLKDFKKEFETKIKNNLK